ncbi:hypothetical protein Hypma_005741 [Hypsizygus marmoreus]|uniref:Uncharacterized protein n=1 Tax=Hypsizygus marmoreus TaxID=39966 RepID=A0A369K9X3_HYPMA|nr:hypothetical protein Hypma_005741 [Hypsizygus marmoreus]
MRHLVNDHATPSFLGREDVLAIFCDILPTVCVTSMKLCFGGPSFSWTRNICCLLNGLEYNAACYALRSNVRIVVKVMFTLLWPPNCAMMPKVIDTL